MAEFWTGKEYKEAASVGEIKAGLNHLISVLQGLANENRPDLSDAEAKKLLSKIDEHFAVYNTNAAALDGHHVRIDLADRVAIIAGLKVLSDHNQGQ